MADNSMFWDINKSLSYNALFNFIIGNRGGGKTYGFKEHVIKNFIKRGEQFVYVRRYKEELKKNDKFFNDIEDAFPEHSFEVKQMKYFIDGKEAGMAIPLSIAKIFKSTPFPLVTTIGFDEFIIDVGTYHYLKDEVVNFLELYETISRSRDVRVFFLSNALTVSNPYFMYFGLQVPYGSNISCGNDILIEMVAKEEYIKMKKATRFGKIIEGTQYGEYAMNNQFLRDNRNFVQKKTAGAKYYFTIVYKGESYGIYQDYKEGLMFVSNEVDPSCKLIYALTTTDHKPNMMLIKSKRKSPLLSKLIEYYEIGVLRFESVAIKNITMEIIKMLI